jgi:hypothetical protein
MKNLFVLALLVLASATFAQNSASANGEANATLICALSNTTQGAQTVEFGCWINNGGGTLTITPGSDAVANGGNLFAYTGSNAQCLASHDADFSFSGACGFTYTTSIDALDESSDDNDDLMEFNDGVTIQLTHNADGSFGGECDFGECVSETFSVGGVLTAGAGDYGNYNSSFAVTLSYN